MTTETTYRITLSGQQVIKMWVKLGNAAAAFEKKGEAAAKKVQAKLFQAATGAKGLLGAMKSAAKQRLSGLSASAAKAAVALKMAATAARQVGRAAKGARRLADAVGEIGRAAHQAGAGVLGIAAAGAKISMLQTAYAKLGGMQKDIAELREATAGMVPDSALMKMRSIATLSGISSENIKKLAKVATGAAASMGRGFTESFSRIILGTSKLEKEFFDELGIKVRSMTVVFSEFAKSAGRSMASLTEAEKQTLYVQEVLRNSTKQLQIQEIAKQDVFASALTQFENVQDVMKVMFGEMMQGSGLLDTLGRVMMWLKDTFEENESAITQLIMVGFNQLIAFLPPALELFESFLPLMPLVIAGMDGLRGSMFALAPIINTISYVIGYGIGGALAVLLGALGKTLSALASVTDALGIPFPDSARKAGEELEHAAGEAFGMSDGLEVMDRALATSTTEMAGLMTSAKKTQETLLKMAKVVPPAFEAVAGFIERGTMGMIDLTNASEQSADQIAGDLKTVFGFIRSAHEAVEFGVNATAETIIETSKTQQKALHTLGAQFDEVYESLVRLKEVGEIEVWEFDVAEALLHKHTERTEELIFKAEKYEDKSRKRRTNKAKKGAEEQAKWAAQARFMTMSELEQQIAESDKEYDEVLTKLKGHEDLKFQIIDQRAKARRAIIREHNKMQAEAQNAVYETTLSARELSLKKERDAVKEHFAALREAVGGFDVTGRLAGAEAAQLQLIDTEQAAADFEALKTMATGFVDFVTPAFDKVEERLNKVSDIMTKRSARDMKIWSSAVQNMGSTFGTTLVQMATSGEDMREQTAQMMGQLFGQLSTAFLLWATAEGNLLAGMPWAAAGVAIALGVVAAAMSSFSSRGKGGAAGGAGGGGATSTAARLASREVGKRRGDQDRTGIIVYNYGFEQPDGVAQRVERGTRRAQSLRGSSSGRSAA